MTLLNCIGCKRRVVSFLYKWTLKRALGSIKVKVEVKFILEQTTKAQSGSRGITLLFL